MSQESASEVVAEVQALSTGNYIQFALISLVTYEYLITFRQEVGVFWSRPQTGASLLFLSNRYLLVMYSIVFPLTQNCNVVLRLSEAIDIAQQIVFALFSALRIYAIWDRNILLFAPIMALLLVPVGTALFFFTTVSTHFIGPPFVTCNVTTTLPDTVLRRVTQGTRIPVILADALVLVLTWIKTFGNKREAMQLSMQLPLTTLLLRDGTLYFVVLLSMNIAQMILNSTNFGYMDPFLNMLTPVLISRFMMNLRGLNKQTTPNSEFIPSRFSAIDFHLSPSLGGPLVDSLDPDANDANRDKDGVVDGVHSQVLDRMERSD